MIKLRYGVLASIIVTGFLIFIQFLWSQPDGKLHLTFCDVGQGDAAYVRMPTGSDVLIDTGPGNRVLGCLGKWMPFWDRDIDTIFITHPQKDHMGGLAEVLLRYRVKYLLTSGIPSEETFYTEAIALAERKGTVRRSVDRGDQISLGDVTLAVLWPTTDLAASMGRSDTGDAAVAGAVSDRDPNDGSIVLHLTYGDFDAVFTGDADSRVQNGFTDSPWGGDRVEILKVPHHGSREAVTPGFLEAVRPELAVISVGKNTYGHPAPELLEQLENAGVLVERTDLTGGVTIVSDGRIWQRE